MLDEAVEEKAGGEKVRIGMVVRDRDSVELLRPCVLEEVGVYQRNVLTASFEQ